MNFFKKYICLVLILTIFVLPVVSLAQTASTTTGTTTLGCVLKTSPRIGDLLKYVTCIISSSVIPLIFALAVAMFIWGVVQYVINGEEEAKKAKGKQFMIWGIIALAVMVSVWGLVSILTHTFGISSGKDFIPQLPTQ